MKELQQPENSSKSPLENNTIHCEPGTIHQLHIYITPCTSRAFRQAAFKCKANEACLINRRAITSCKGIHICKMESEITYLSCSWKETYCSLTALTVNGTYRKHFHSLLPAEPALQQQHWASHQTVMAWSECQLEQLCLVFQQLLREDGFTCYRLHCTGASAGIKGNIKSKSTYAPKVQSL